MGQIHKQNLDFESATFLMGGERSPDWATGAVLAPPKNNYNELKRPAKQVATCATGSEA